MKLGMIIRIHPQLCIFGMLWCTYELNHPRDHFTDQSDPHKNHQFFFKHTGIPIDSLCQRPSLYTIGDITKQGKQCYHVSMNISQGLIL